VCSNAGVNDRSPAAPEVPLGIPVGAKPRVRQPGRSLQTPRERWAL